MKIVEREQFFVQAEWALCMQLINKMNQQLKDQVEPFFQEGIEEYEYVHFLVLERIEGPLYISAHTLYVHHEGHLIRTIESLRTYESEIDMEFYMALLEYDNTISPSPILFNGKGTHADAYKGFWFTENIAANAKEDQHLN